jgi:hypothetical protein
MVILYGELNYSCYEIQSFSNLFSPSFLIIASD